MITKRNTQFYDQEMEEETVKQENNDQENEFAVKKIHQHELDYDENGKTTLLFQVKWEGYPNKNEYTWQTEDSLMKCYDLVKEYRAKNKIVPTTLQPIGGTDLNKNAKLINAENWIKLDEIEQTAKQYLAHNNFKTNLKLVVKHSTDIEAIKEDTILITLHKNL